MDGCNFNWGASMADGTPKFPKLSTPCASYHGLNFWSHFGSMRHISLPHSFFPSRGISCVSLQPRSLSPGLPLWSHLLCVCVYLINHSLHEVLRKQLPVGIHRVVRAAHDGQVGHRYVPHHIGQVSEVLAQGRGVA